jgi:hypothetical protein
MSSLVATAVVAGMRVGSTTERVYIQVSRAATHARLICAGLPVRKLAGDQVAAAPRAPQEEFQGRGMLVEPFTCTFCGLVSQMKSALQPKVPSHLNSRQVRSGAGAALCSRQGGVCMEQVPRVRRWPCTAHGRACRATAAP